MVVRRKFPGRLGRDRLARKRCQPTGNRRSYDAGDFELDFEQVRQPAVLALRPRLARSFAVDEVEREPQALTGAADRASEEMAHAEGLANSGGITLLGRDVERRVARHDEKIFVA